MVHRPADLDDGVAKLEVQCVVTGPVRHALSNGEIEEAADAVEVGVNSGDLGERLRVERAFQASTYEATSENLCAREARLPSERIKPREIIVVHASLGLLANQQTRREQLAEDLVHILFA